MSDSPAPKKIIQLGLFTEAEQYFQNYVGTLIGKLLSSPHAMPVPQASNKTYNIPNMW